MKRILILAATLALAGCGAAEPKIDLQAEKAAVDKLRDDFVAAFNAGDAMKIGELYAEKAVMMPNEKPTVTGRAAIVDYNKATFEQASAKISITPANTTFSKEGDVAIDEGTYMINVLPKATGAQPITDEGRYLVILRKTEGKWQVIDDIDNRPIAATPPPPPPAKPKAASKPASKAPSKSKTKGK